jgi:hypothetical protein
MMMAKTRNSIAVLLLVVAASPAFSQMTEQEVRTRLDAAYAGKSDQVSRELPALLRQNPHDAGVLYIQAVLTTDGTLAVKRYQEIAEKYPQSVWADDALYKVYQYNFSLGLYKKADEVMEQLRSRYPQSIYVTGIESKGAAVENRSAAAPAQAVAPAAVEKKAEPLNKETVPERTPLVSKKKAEPLNKETVPERTQPAVQHGTASGKFYVQVGVFSTEANARKAAELYGGKAGRVASVTPKTSGGKTQYLVRFEGFDTADSAHSFSAELRTKHHIESFVFPTSGSNQNPNAR